MADDVLDIDVERIKRLPQRSDDTWQGGLVHLPVWFEDGSALVRPRAGLWLSLRTGLIGRSELVPLDESNLEQALRALVDFACNEELAGYRSGRLEVSDREQAKQLEAWLAGSGIEVEQRERLPELEAFLAGMARDLDGGDAPPDVLSGRGVTIDRLRAFADAAREFYEAALWQHLSDDDLIRIEAPFVDAGMQNVTIMGAGGEALGLAFFESAREHAAMAEGSDLARYLASRRTWAVTFGSLLELPPWEAALWVDHGLPAAGEQAYPRAACFGPKRRISRPSSRKLAFLEGLLRVLARTGEPKLDAGRWSTSVTTADGQMRFKLSLSDAEQAATDDAPEDKLARMLADPRARERMTAHIQRVFRDQDFDSIQDAVAFANANLTGRKIPDRPGTTALDRAQDLVYGAVEQRGRRRLRLAGQALEISPDCADAYVLLAEGASDRGKALELYAEGVAAGERALDPRAFEEDAGHFWGVFETRPYMRARLGLAQCLEACGRSDEAVEHYREMLRLDSGDHQGIRYFLITRLLERCLDLEAGRLLKSFKEDASALWLYAGALIAFRRSGDGVTSRKRLAKALEANERVTKYLLGKRQLPMLPPPSYGFGDENEAVICAMELREVWNRTPGARAWLAAHRGPAIRTPPSASRRFPKVEHPG